MSKTSRTAELTRVPSDSTPYLTYPTTIHIIYSTSHEGCLIAEKESDHIGDLDWFSPPLLNSDLQTSLHVLWILTLRHWRVDGSLKSYISLRRTAAQTRPRSLPGETQLTRIFWFSLAAVRVRPITAALVAQYAALPGAPN